MLFRVESDTGRILKIRPGSWQSELSGVVAKHRSGMDWTRVALKLASLCARRPGQDCMDRGDSQRKFLARALDESEFINGLGQPDRCNWYGSIG